MTRLQAEWHRLYLSHPGAAPSTADDAPKLIDAEGRVRAMVLTLARPADWASLSVLWKAVQADLALPAPAIAVSGVDAYQLWFSLAEAVPVPEAHAFVDLLRQRYLGHIAPARVGLLPAWSAEAPEQARHAAHIPGEEVLTEQWSAFVAPDLAPMFAETPWLDIAPSPEGQAELLAGLRCITPTDWQTALALLQPKPVTSAASSTSASAENPKRACADARRFLIDVMNDEAVALALRIEAAKALLPYTPPAS